MKQAIASSSRSSTDISAIDQYIKLNDAKTRSDDITVDILSTGSFDGASTLIDSFFHLMHSDNTSYIEKLRKTAQDPQTNMAVLMSYIAEVDFSSNTIPQEHRAQVALVQSYCYEYGIGCVHDEAKDNEYKKQAASLGNLDAQYDILNRRAHHETIPAEGAEIASDYLVLAKLGHSKALFDLAHYYTDEGLGTISFKKTGIKISTKDAHLIYSEMITKAIALDNNDARYVRGLDMLGGERGEVQHTAEGLRYIEQAAIRGHADSMVALGYYCDEILHDTDVAAKWFSHAWKDKQNLEGLFAWSGIVEREDSAKSFALLSQAAEFGHHDAQMDYAAIVLNPYKKQSAIYKGPFSSDQKNIALGYVTTGAEKNYKVAIRMLAACHESGIMVEKNEQKVRELYAKHDAIEQDNAPRCNPVYSDLNNILKQFKKIRQPAPESVGNKGNTTIEVFSHDTRYEANRQEFEEKFLTPFASTTAPIDDTLIDGFMKIVQRHDTDHIERMREIGKNPETLLAWLMRYAEDMKNKPDPEKPWSYYVPLMLIQSYGYEYGIVHPKDDEKKTALREMAAYMGSHDAQFYFIGHNKNASERMDRYRPLVQAGHTGAMVELALLYKERNNLANYKTLIRQAIDGGNNDACYLHARDCIEGINGEERNVQIGLRYLMQSAVRGHTKSMVGAGYYLQAKGEHELSIKWFTRAWKHKGNHEALFILAQDGQKEHTDTSFIKKLAELGHPIARLAYDNPSDENKARAAVLMKEELYNKSSLNKNSGSVFNEFKNIITAIKLGKDTGRQVQSAPQGKDKLHKGPILVPGQIADWPEESRAKKDLEKTDASPQSLIEAYIYLATVADDKKRAQNIDYLLKQEHVSRKIIAFADQAIKAPPSDNPLDVKFRGNCLFIKMFQAKYDENDQKKAFEYGKDAAGYFQADAMYLTAHHYRDGIATEVDFKRYAAYLTGAKGIGHDRACNEYALLQLDGGEKYGIERSEEKGIELLKKTAVRNNPEAYYLLAQYYRSKDADKYRDYLTKASVLAHPQAMFEAAGDLRHGNEKDQEDAKILYHRAAMYGHIDSYNTLMEWNKESNNIMPQFDYAEALLLGHYQGQFKDKKTREKVGFEYLRKVHRRDNSHVGALQNLVWCYENGIGTAKDPDKARHYKKKWDAIVPDKKHIETIDKVISEQPFKDAERLQQQAQQDARKAASQAKKDAKEKERKATREAREKEREKSAADSAEQRARDKLKEPVMQQLANITSCIKPYADRVDQRYEAIRAQHQQLRTQLDTHTNQLDALEQLKKPYAKLEKDRAADIEIRPDYHSIRNNIVLKSDRNLALFDELQQSVNRKFLPGKDRRYVEGMLKAGASDTATSLEECINAARARLDERSATEIAEAKKLAEELLKELEPIEITLISHNKKLATILEEQQKFLSSNNQKRTSAELQQYRANQLPIRTKQNGKDTEPQDTFIIRRKMIRKVLDTAANPPLEVRPHQNSQATTLHPIAYVSSDAHIQPSTAESVQRHMRKGLPIAQAKLALEQLDSVLNVHTPHDPELQKYALLKLIGQTLEAFKNCYKSYKLRGNAYDRPVMVNARNVIFHDSPILARLRPEDVVANAREFHRYFSGIIDHLMTKGGFTERHTGAALLLRKIPLLSPAGLTDPVLTRQAREAAHIVALYSHDSHVTKEIIAAKKEEYRAHNVVALFSIDHKLQLLRRTAGEPGDAVSLHGRDMLQSMIGERLNQIQKSDPDFIQGMAGKMYALIGDRMEMAHLLRPLDPERIAKFNSNLPQYQTFIQGKLAAYERPVSPGLVALSPERSPSPELSPPSERSLSPIRSLSPDRGTLASIRSYFAGEALTTYQQAAYVQFELNDYPQSLLWMSADRVVRTYDNDASPNARQAVEDAFAHICASYLSQPKETHSAREMVAEAAARPQRHSI